MPSERARHPVFDPGRDEETKEPPIPNIHNEIHGCKEIAARRAGRRIENMRKKYSRDSRVPAFLNFTYCRQRTRRRGKRLATETTPAKFLFAGGDGDSVDDDDSACNLPCDFAVSPLRTRRVATSDGTVCREFCCRLIDVDQVFEGALLNSY